MAVKQVFETYVYAYLLSSSAIPPFVLGRICQSKGKGMVGASLLAIQATRAGPPPQWIEFGLGRLSVQQIELQVFSHGLCRRRFKFWHTPQAGRGQTLGQGGEVLFQA